MSRLKTICCILLLISVAHNESKAEKRRILFIGNSYTAVNDLPLILYNLALSKGDTLEYDSNTPGGMTFNGHSTNASTLAKIQSGNWDYVVLQAQSQEPSFSPTQVAADTYPYAKKLDSIIHVYNPCAETVFYMTWGRKNGDAANCAAYPPVCTYEGMQQRLRESYLEMSDLNNATCAPVGVAWKRIRDLSPGIELYSADESHPSIHGTYLTACVVYSTLFHKESNGASNLPAGILTWQALTLQNQASITVLDSLENWQQYGSLPMAKYIKSNTFNQFTFTNQSLRASSYTWDFGDGSPLSNATSPVHTYTTAGNYVVKLTAINNCGKKDIFIDTAKAGGVTSTNDINSDYPGSVYVQNNNLQVQVSQPADHLSIMDSNGRKVFGCKLHAAFTTYPLPALPEGLYFFQIAYRGKSIKSGKVMLL